MDNIQIVLDKNIELHVKSLKSNFNELIYLIEEMYDKDQHAKKSFPMMQKQEYIRLNGDIVTVINIYDKYNQGMASQKEIVIIRRAYLRVIEGLYRMKTKEESKDAFSEFPSKIESIIQNILHPPVDI